MKKIGLVIPSLQAGGMERVMSELAAYFAANEEYAVELILYGKGRTIFYPLPQNIRIHQPSFTFDDRRRVISTLKTMRYLRQTIKNIKPDTVLSFGEYWNSFVLMSLWGLNQQIYISDRCQPDKKLHAIHELLRKVLYRRAAGIITQTPLAKEIYTSRKLNNNIKVIGNPVRSISINGNAGKKARIVLSVGRLIKSKHHDRLIKIFKKAHVQGWKLVIVGGDALKQNGMDRLKNLIHQLNMEDIVELKGTVRDIDSYYRKSSIFAFTSSSEGFPNVIGEALSAGLPVLSYDALPGILELVEDGKNGYLIPLFNDELYALKLKELMLDNSKRSKMGEKSKDKSSMLSIEKIGEKYRAFIMQ